MTYIFWIMEQIYLASKDTPCWVGCYECEVRERCEAEDDLLWELFRNNNIDPNIFFVESRW